MRLFLPNLDFDDRLTGRSASPESARALRELGPAMGLLANDGDAVLVDDVPDSDAIPDLLQHVRFVTKSDELSGIKFTTPFGWLPETSQIYAQSPARTCHAPTTDATRTVNGRHFGARFDRFGRDSAPHFSAHFGHLGDSENAVKTLVKSFSEEGFERCVVKPLWSHAGRNRAFLGGDEFSEQQSNWVRKQLTQSGAVYVEPWVERSHDWGLQYEIAPPPSATSDLASDDAPTAAQLIGTTKLINDDQGRYQGTLIAHDDLAIAAPKASVEHGFRVCEAARAEGYFGPLGIDTFRFFRPDGTTAIRLCNDINGRFTMGRLALGLLRVLPARQIGYWGIFRAETFARNLPPGTTFSQQIEFGNVRVMVSTPWKTRQQLHRLITAFLTGPTETEVLQVQRRLLGRQP